MGIVLPTLTIVLAEIAAVLLILVGFLLYRIRRLRHLHQAELNTLMTIAGNARLRSIPPAAESRAMMPEAPPAGTEHHQTPESPMMVVANAQATDSARPAPLPVPKSTPASLAALLDPDSMSDLFALRTDGIDVEEINLTDLDIENPHGLRNEPGTPSRFDEERIFFHASPAEGRDQGWYFSGFGDYPHGPFADKDVAARVMKEMHEQLTTLNVPLSAWAVSRK